MYDRTDLARSSSSRAAARRPVTAISGVHDISWRCLALAPRGLARHEPCPTPGQSAAPAPLPLTTRAPPASWVTHA